MNADVEIMDYGSTVSFRPVSDAAKEWFKENVQYEPWQKMGGQLIVDHRPAQTLVEGLEEAGFILSNG